tara:strand:- start:4055 stop:5092 length:1038 start_codon:yes stop_codon:yes gene_type:complete
MSFSQDAKQIDRFFRERSKVLKVNFDKVNFQTVNSGSVAGAGSFLAVDDEKNLVLASPAAATQPVTALNNQAVSRLVTIGATTTELDGEANLTYDGTTFVIDDDTRLNDNHKFHFGTNSDAHIEYDEDGNDILIISGSAQGIVLKGTKVEIDGVLEGGSPLKIGGEVQFVSTGEASAFNFGPNGESKIFFGDDSFLTLSGSTTGTVISGSSLTIETTKGMGVGVVGDAITHAITLPNNDDSTGRIKANAFVSYSSQRYKKDIKILNDPMEVLNKIEGVSFKWKDTDRLDYGFIAEDVGKVLPNIVSWENNKRDAQGMDYLKIISFLVEAVKNQQKEINKLKQTVK